MNTPCPTCRGTGTVDCGIDGLPCEVCGETGVRPAFIVVYTFSCGRCWHYTDVVRPFRVKQSRVGNHVEIRHVSDEPALREEPFCSNCGNARTTFWSRSREPARPASTLNVA